MLFDKEKDMTEEFKRIIDEDIDICTAELHNGDQQSRYTFHQRLISKYGNIIDGFKADLHQLFYDESGAYALENIETMRQKLVLFKAMGYQNVYAESDSGITVNNTNQMTANINITFSEAKSNIERMSALSDPEIEEILQKINELENIVNSTKRKTKKWDKAKDIIHWIASKGVDVAMTIIPLLMKIGA